MNEKYLIFHVEGGLGKNIAATAVLTHLKKQHADRNIVVVASYPEIFLNNENVYRTYKIGNTPYFFDNYIKDKDTIVMRKEPYHENDHIMRNTPLYETWFNMYGISYDKKTIKPYLPMNGAQKLLVNVWNSDKPIFLIHTNGGPLDVGMQPNSYAWTRDMPMNIAQEITNEAARKYHVVQVCRENSYQLQNAQKIDKPMTNFELFSLVLASSKRLFIDSSLHHAAAAYDLESVVLWIGTDPKMFGYPVHHNIKAEDPSGKINKIDSYIFDYDFNGHFHEYPYYDHEKLFDTKKILKELNL